jgi:hypothetical protein
MMLKVINTDFDSDIRRKTTKDQQMILKYLSFIISKKLTGPVSPESIQPGSIRFKVKNLDLTADSNLFGITLLIRDLMVESDTLQFKFLTRDRTKYSYEFRITPVIRDWTVDLKMK